MDLERQKQTNKKKNDVWHNYWVTALFVKDSF